MNDEITAKPDTAEAIKRSEKFPSKSPYVISVAVGAAYGLGVRMLADSNVDVLAVMSIGFILFTPFALGYISVLYR
jgi:hypothetical protein